MIYHLGPCSRRVYDVLREQILGGKFAAGAKLPPHTDMAAEFGVASLTVRQALAHLEDEGLVSREQGRGTFVRSRARPAVLIVEDEVPSRTLLGEYITRAGYRVVEAAGPAEGLAALKRDPAIALVLSDVRIPTTEAGIGFIQAVQRRWPELPLAVTGYAQDLAELHGTPECPVLILPKPFRARQIEETLRLALRLHAR